MQQAAPAEDMLSSAQQSAQREEERGIEMRESILLIFTNCRFS
jgi:hypothetical protein